MLNVAGIGEINIILFIFIIGLGYLTSGAIVTGVIFFISSIIQKIEEKTKSKNKS